MFETIKDIVWNYVQVYAYVMEALGFAIAFLYWRFDGSTFANAVENVILSSFRGEDICKVLNTSLKLGGWIIVVGTVTYLGFSFISKYDFFIIAATLLLASHALVMLSFTLLSLIVLLLSLLTFRCFDVLRPNQGIVNFGLSLALSGLILEAYPTFSSLP